MKSLLKKYLKTSIILVFIISFINISVLAQSKAVKINYKEKEYIVGHDIVSFIVKEKYYNDELLKKFEESNYKIVFTSAKYRSVYLRTDGKSDILEYFYKFEKEEYVENVFFPGTGSFCSVPNDEHYSLQYALPKIKLPEAWNLTTGDTSVKIAILDTGIPLDNNGNLSHPDLSNSNRIILGQDFSVSQNGLNDKSNISHGTKVAGVLGAETNNGIGIAGVCYNSKVVIYKVGGDGPNPDPLPSNVYAAVIDAVQRGCQIISMSVIFFDDINTNGIIEDMINYAQQNNVLIVAAAGNVAGNWNGQWIHGGVQRPAKYANNFSNLIAVSATDMMDSIAAFSSIGPEVRICAPGADIYTTIGYSGTTFYWHESGTSMSAPIVAGVAALVKSKFPHYSAAQIRTQIELSADDLGDPGRDNLFGFGRVNAYNSVKNLYVPQMYSTIQDALNYATVGQTIVLTGTHTENSLLTIPAGITLQIEADANVTFSGGLTVNGAIKANGTAQNKVTLNFGSIKSLIINNSTTTFFEHTIFQASRHDGICVNGSDIYFSDCEICGSAIGILASSSIINLNKTWFPSLMVGFALSNHSTGYVRQNNIFKCIDHSIVGDVTSYINAGDSITPGYNSFRLAGAWLSSYPGIKTMPAWYNYWGMVPGVTSNIDASYPIINDPNPYIKLGDNHKTEEAEVESGLLLKRSVIKNDEPIEKVDGIEELDKATQLLSNKKYDEALPEMHRLVDKYKDGFVGKRALVFIENILTETERVEEILPKLERYSNDESKVAEFARYRKGYHYLYLGEYDKGIEIMKGVEFSEEDTDLRQARLYDLGVAHHDLLGKKAEAYCYFNELVKTYPDCQLAKMTSTFYNVTKDGYEKPVKDEEIITPAETKLFVNYPNPFNPSTVIKYQLSDASQVSLKVYDVMGREVAVLVNSYQNKGSYDVTFNANGLSSGIYFYKLNAGEKQFINKMLLMK